MSDLYYYTEALKLGQKSARASSAKGQDPYLPALDELVPPERSATGVDLGLVQVPAEFIVGTKTRGRTESFASNFMPVLPETSEFAAKWYALCRAHLAEGIREPVKLYEYLNRFYVAEGNKRVSVLKFFDAPTIPAHVIRVLPERTGDPEIENYYDFVAFYRLSRVGFLELSKPGGYAVLQRLLGKAADEAWTEEERRRFSAAFYRFRKVYQASGGGKLRATTGDALLAFLKVYGYPQLLTPDESALKKDISLMWEDLALQQEDPTIEVKTAPATEKKQRLLTRVLPTGQTVKKVAFLYDKTPELSGWTLAHEQGRRHLQRVFDGQIETCAYENVMEGAGPVAAMEHAIAEGCGLIFATAPRILPASLRVAVAHPEVVVMNCSVNQRHRYVRSYYGRMYEAKFIIGAIAATLSDSDELGYVADYPIFGQIAGINAFALGAQMINPRAKVQLSWSSVRDGANADAALVERGMRLISTQDSARIRRGSSSGFGLYRIEDSGERTLLASPLWRWDVYYETILRRLQDNTVKEEYERSNRALNYYWGMSAGVIDLRWDPALPRGTRRLADYLRESIAKEVCNPFLAPLHTQDGALIGEHQRALSIEQIIGMDYLVDNVIGSIPAYAELSELAQSTVDAAGVAPSVRGVSEEHGT